MARICGPSEVYEFIAHQCLGSLDTIFHKANSSPAPYVMDRLTVVLLMIVELEPSVPSIVMV